MVTKQKILIVDDDNNIAELISLYLTKECGFKGIPDFSPEPDSSGSDASRY